MMTEPADPAAEDGAALLQAVARGIASAEAGRLVGYEQVRRWILSWGTDAELDPPQCK
jgi:predicted transcriptional regulator